MTYTLQGNLLKTIIIVGKGVKIEIRWKKKRTQFVVFRCYTIIIISERE